MAKLQTYLGCCLALALVFTNFSLVLLIKKRVVTLKTRSLSEIYEVDKCSTGKTFRQTSKILP